MIAAGVLVLFVFISFVVSYECARRVSAMYQDAVADAALDFAQLTINADQAKEYFTTRNKTENDTAVQNKLKAYQQHNRKTIARLSLVSFSNTDGSYIYDSNGSILGERLEYDDFTSTVKAELINGRNAIRHQENGTLTVYHPIRTVDDHLCGFIIVALQPPLEYAYLPHFLIAFAGMVLLGIVFTFLLSATLERRLFRPIKRITDSAVYLSGDDSVQEGKDASVMFDTSRKDEIGQLSAALQKIFFDMNTGAEHLSQALFDANHDGMTQTLNKRCYHSMEETFRTCDPICVIYFDVNNLKLMNDTLGHENGDRVIKRAAEYIRGFLGQGDYCFRMGGDEFLLVMTACTYRSADQVLTRLDKDAPYILSRESDSVKCALSYGCAFGTGAGSFDEALTEAEENMYAKKAELKALLQMPER